MEPTWTGPAPHDLFLHTALTASGIQGVRVGGLIDVSDGVWVVYDDQPTSAPVPARSTVPITPGDAGRSVLLVFENGDPERPIITGFLQEEPVAASLEKAAVEDVRVDGRRVCLEADKEIVLRCGKSSVTLRADGKIVILGMEIVSRARGTHKVKGGTVRIN